MTTLRSDVEALFVREGDLVVPTVHAVGPWRPDAVHGSALAALMASVLDKPESNVARLTVDLFGSVPLRPLALDPGEERGGRTVQRRTASLSDDGRLLVAATALYITRSDVAVPEGDGTSVEPPAELALLPESRAGWPGFESRSLALHTERSGEGHVRGWFSLLVPPIAGQSLTPFHSAVAAADYTSAGTSMILSLKKWMFMSVDLTVNFARRPTGEWVGLEAPASMLGTQGAGIASSVMHDREGLFARVSQTQRIQPVPG